MTLLRTAATSCKLHSFTSKEEALTVPADLQGNRYLVEHMHM